MITTSLAETVGVTNKQAVGILEALAALAYRNARNKFTIPGLGKLVLVNRKARMGRNPATGAAIKVAAKKVVKFRVAKAAILAEEPPSSASPTISSPPQESAAS
ncbi:MAG: HU family DNA-binding protein [Limisphaerales bacterium]